ncbi:winged helix-turn-helix transcriptional regulator [Planktothrix mougeotii]|uniref:winged helix-turn-helix transcriptional regulator n=1 Tax=Planktothrix mougeotii TaxID=54306 RepID=UPI003899F31D
MKLLIDNPSLSNREIAKQLNVTEATIRYWKKQSFWEVERVKMLDDMAEALNLKDERRREEFKESIREGRRKLAILREQIYANTARSINISSKAYATASMMNDALKACGMLTKAGAHTHGKQALDGIKTIMAVDEHLYQFDLLIDLMDRQDEDDEEE